MTKGKRGGFADVKGADLLGKLREALAPPKPEQPTSQPSRISLEQELMAAAEKARAKARQEHSRQAQRKPEAAPSSKSKKITSLKFGSSRNREEALAAMRAAEVPSSPRPSGARSTAVTHDFGAAAYKKLEPYRQSLEGFIATHRSGQAISVEDEDLARQRIHAGATLAAAIVDAEDGYFLGYDFGTSTTKVVARYPYGGVDEAFAIPMPKTMGSDGLAHLCPTAVWYDPNSGQFSLTPQEGCRLLDSFKSALLQGSGHRICKGSGLTMMEAATAFLGLHFAYTIGAAVEEAEQFRLAAINVGVPVAVLGGNQKASFFERVVKAATCLVERADNLTIHDVRTALEDAPAAAQLPFTLHAELSGAIAGYCSAPRFYVGGHMIIDCGSATLDIATFDLDQRSNRPIGIYAAMVESLGADACDTFIKQGISLDECRSAVRHQEHLVFRETLERRSSLFAQDANKYPYQIILIGGGIHGEVHAPFFTRMGNAFARPFHRPKIAESLRYDAACEPGRLILADGLARDPIDLKDVALPKEPPRILIREAQYIGPEQM